MVWGESWVQCTHRYTLHLILAETYTGAFWKACCICPVILVPAYLPQCGSVLPLRWYPGDSSGFLPKLLGLEDLKQIFLSSLLEPTEAQEVLSLCQTVFVTHTRASPSRLTRLVQRGILFFWCLWPKSTPIFWFNVYFSFMSKLCQFWAQVKRKPVYSTSTPACFMCAWDERGLTLWRTCGGERSAFETSSTVWVSGIELGSLDLVAGVFIFRPTHQPCVLIGGK